MGSGTQQLVLVTGGSGFLGSHVVDALLAAGHRVRVFDLKRSPTLPAQIEFVSGNILDQKAVERAAQDCESIIHFAGAADIDRAKDRPFDTAEANILGTIRMLEAARNSGARRFLFSSTVYVFSEAGSFYRASKQACERFIECYNQRYGLEYTILRYGSLYGRRSDERNSVHRMICEALETGRITYHGDGDAIREYVHVEDAARLTVEALGDQYTNRHLVLTGTERLRVRDVMRMIAEMAPRPVELRFEVADHLHHYVMTPYSFTPKVGHKVVLNDFVDIGQGLLDCFAEAHSKLGKEKPPKIE